MSALGLLALRVTLAVVLVAHGANQLFGLWGGPGVGPGGLSTTAAHFSGIGIEPAFIFAVLVSVVQIVGGVLIALGWLTRWAALTVFVYEIVIGWIEHRPYGFFLNWSGLGAGHGVEFAFLMAGGLLCLLMMGGGDWSIDGWRESTAASRAAGRARLRRKL